MALALEPRFVFSSLRPGVLALAPLAGGAARRLLPRVNAADWSPDGRELAVARVDGEESGARVEWPPGKVVYHTDGFVAALRVSPDGNRLACIEAIANNERVILVEKGGAVKELLTGRGSPNPGLAWSPDGRRVYFSLARQSPEPSLSAVDLHGEERPLLALPGGLRLEDVARDGRVLLTHLRVSLQLRVGSADAAVDRDLSWFTSSFVNDVSADGRRLLFGEDEPEGSALYLRDVDGAVAVRIGGGFSLGAFSPDATRIAAITSDQDRLLSLPVREGETVELPRGTIRRFDGAAWLPDGRHLLILAADAEGKRVFQQALEGGPPHPVTEPIAADTFCPSPDGGRFVASDGRRLVIYSLDGSPPRPVPGEHTERRLLRWSADGRAVFTYRVGDRPGHLYRIDLATGGEQVVRTLLPPDPTGVVRIHPVVVTPDGRTWAYTATQILSDLYVYSGLR
jgi:Tol biopolymer transport system component